MEHKIIVAMKSIILYNTTMQSDPLAMNKDKVLIVQRAANDFGGGSWEFVGGKLEFGEDLISGLKREIMEEVGLDVEIEKLLYATTFKTHNNRQIVILNYLSYCKNNKVVLSEEHDNYQWVGMKTMRRLLTKDILYDLEVNGILEKLNICEE